MTINNVIFDFGGVLFDWNPRYLYRKIMNSEEEVEEFLTNVCTWEWNCDFDKGVSFEENTQKLIKLHPQKKDLINAYADRWGEMVASEIVGTIDVMRELKDKEVNLYGLTNMGVEPYNYLMKKYEFLNLFKDIVASGIEKAVKPEKDIYNILLDRNELNPEDCIFIDDKEENIIVGEKLGIKGIHFTNPEDLKRELTILGVI